MVLILLLSGAAMLATGCSGMSSSSAAPGTYVIQVTGTGVNSNVIHYQNVTLNITK
jgi:ABC-type glycerol-3-phosphate transport system substrate-binding protein